MITSDKPIYQEFDIDGVQHITPHNALAELQNETAIMIDVREEAEFKLLSIPFRNVFYYPLSGIVDQLHNIPTDKPIIVVCNAGIRSSKVVNLFNKNDFPPSSNLDGGIIMWKALGLPVDSDISAECGCSCSCPKQK